MEINKWKEPGVIEVGQRPWLQAVNLFRARWMDDPYKEKSKYVVMDFANTIPTMFAAGSDTAVGRVVECKVVLRNCSIFAFDVTSTYRDS